MTPYGEKIKHEKKFGFLVNRAVVKRLIEL